MNLNINKNFVTLFFISVITIAAFYIVNYKYKLHNTNQEIFNKTIYQQAKTHFENMKVFRAWNAKFGGVYVKANAQIKPNEYLKDNTLYSKDGDLLIKVNPAWMTRQVSDMINEISESKYRITSLNPLNPNNKANKFEKDALVFFERNSDKNYYGNFDKENKSYNFMGKLLVEESCMQCHASQGYKVGEVRGGISVSIPLGSYEYDLEELSENLNLQVMIIVIFSIFLIALVIYIIDRIFKSKENLKELKNRYKLLYDRYDYAVSGSKLGLWDWNLQTDEVYFSKLWKEMLGYKEDEIRNHLDEWNIRVHPEDKQKAISDIMANQNKETVYYENIHRLRHKDGSWVWILDKGRTIFDENGNPVRMLGFHTNITKSQELKNELTKLKIAIEHSPLSIVITNKNGDIEYVNPHFCSVTGYSFDEAIGENPRILKSEFMTSDEYRKLWDTLTSKKTWKGTFKNINKKGEEFWESAIITPIFNNNSEIINFLAIKQEITKEVYLKEELKDKEEMMIAQSRHAAMGEMISMIAHQWRQPISIISMAANNILVDLELGMTEEEELKDVTESILEQTSYLSQTIDDFRDFFKPNKEKEIIKVTEVIDETLKIMDKSLENNAVNVELEIIDDIEVKVYSRELLQVFINIVKNAKEALVANKIKEKKINISVFKINNMQRIRISDNAGGIPASVIDKIFDPYFSTKDEKSGTGLGLYMCKTIVNKHFSGEIGAYNYADGACFYVDIPVYKEEENE